MARIEFAAAGRDWTHPVLIGPLDDALHRLQAMGRGKIIPLITDEHVLGLHGERLARHLPVEPIVVPRGEAAKRWTVLIDLIDRLQTLRADRDTPVIAFGGGSVGDVAGLAASLFKRGCPVIHVPTTLLAQADSAIGGKTGIDVGEVKNLVGTFHPPALVLADPALLSTLPERDMRSGFAEVVKYGLIEDAPFFRWCEDHGERLLGGDQALLTHAIDHCLRAKLRFVADDLEDRRGRRALLNFGHSFGHAIESLGGLDRIRHGEAVAVGMVMAMRFSARLGHCAESDVGRVKAHFRSIGLPASLAELGLGGRGTALLPLIAGDKKASGGAITLILSRGIGQAFRAVDVDPAQLGAFLAEAT